MANTNPYAYMDTTGAALAGAPAAFQQGQQQKEDRDFQLQQRQNQQDLQDMQMKQAQTQQANTEAYGNAVGAIPQGQALTSDSLIQIANGMNPNDPDRLKILQQAQGLKQQEMQTQKSNTANAMAQAGKAAYIGDVDTANSWLQKASDPQHKLEFLGKDQDEDGDDTYHIKHTGPDGVSKYYNLDQNGLKMMMSGNPEEALGEIQESDDKESQRANELEKEKLKQEKKPEFSETQAGKERLEAIKNNYALQQIRAQNEGKAGGKAELTPETIDMLADKYIQKGLMDPDTSRDAESRRLVLNRVAEKKASGQDFDLVGNQQKFKTVTDARKFYSTGKGADAFRQQDVIGEHIKTVKSLVDALDNGDLPTANRIAQSYGQSIGKDPVTNYKIGADILSKEVGKYMAGSGPGSAAERKEISDILPAINSPQQFRGGLDTLDKMVKGQRQSWQRQRDSSLQGNVPFPTNDKTVNKSDIIKAVTNGQYPGKTIQQVIDAHKAKGLQVQ